ncbi:Fic family protein [Aeromonas veronii]|uniref:Fic family protein n=1 Tax=Aeromonas veronii TaxID=654 RepID=UPI003F7A8109
MAKARIEKAPLFDLQKLNLAEVIPHFSSYGVVDNKGRYLHWSKLKWYLSSSLSRAEQENIWFAIKMKRQAMSSILPFESCNEFKFNYCTPDVIVSKLHEIDKSTGAYGGDLSGKTTTDQIQKKYLVSSLIMEEAITSAQLEGASTTREVAKKMLIDGREPNGEDERMIINNYLLLKKAKEYKKEELSIELILSFHETATIGTVENKVIPGEFRKSDDIYVEDGDGGIAHQPPAYNGISTRLKMICDFANQSHLGTDGSPFIHPIIKAIILHFMIGYEHPFRDGNGRTARAIFYWFMLKSGYDLFEFVSISKLLREEPRKYGEAYLYSERDQNDLTYFIDYNLDIIIKSINDLKLYLKREKDEFISVLTMMEKNEKLSKLSFHQKEIIKKGIKHPGIIFTAKGIEREYSISNNAARNALNTLVNKQILLSTTEGKITIYIAPGDLKERLSYDG